MFIVIQTLEKYSSNRKTELLYEKEFGHFHHSILFLSAHYTVSILHTSTTERQIWRLLLFCEVGEGSILSFAFEEDSKAIGRYSGAERS